MKFQFLLENIKDTKDLDKLVKELKPILLNWDGTPFEFNEITFKTIDGNVVKDEKEMDFVEGGNGFRYDFIPKDEIWIDKNINSEDWKFIALHEFSESWMMHYMDLSYNNAHDKANVKEHSWRNELIKPKSQRMPLKYRS